MKKIKVKRLLVLAGVILCILLSGFSYYVVRVMSIKKIGVNLRTTKVIEAAKVDFFLQNDDLWKDDYLGNSSYSMGGYGCAITVTASALNSIGCSTTPGELNKDLSQIGGYTNQGDVYWYKVVELFSNVKYNYKRIFSSKTIEKDLEKGIYPIVMVRYGGSGITHWVMIVGSDGEEFLIVDPLRKDKTTIKLSYHGRVYGYRSYSPIQ